MFLFRKDKVTSLTPKGEKVPMVLMANMTRILMETAIILLIDTKKRILVV